MSSNSTEDTRNSDPAWDAEAGVSGSDGGRENNGSKSDDGSEEDTQTRSTLSRRSGSVLTSSTTRSSATAGGGTTVDTRTVSTVSRSDSSASDRTVRLPSFAPQVAQRSTTRVDLPVLQTKTQQPSTTRRKSLKEGSVAKKAMSSREETPMSASKKTGKAKEKTTGPSPFKIGKTALEIGHKSPIYTIAFNPYQHDCADPIFATAARNMVNIYTLDSKTKNFTLMRTIVDDNPAESFFALTWCFDYVDMKHKLVAAGECANVKVIDPDRGTLYEEFIGHGDVVNELRTDPNNSLLFASVSKDTTVRLWNVRINVCLVIFGGQDGHNDQVLSCDWSPDSEFIVSCGMDHSIRMWHLDEECRSLIRLSMTAKGEKEIRERTPESIDKRNSSLSTVPQNMGCIQMQFPNSWTNDLHCDYVDCVRYINWYVVSKGSEKVANIFRFGHVTDPLDQIYDTKPDTACTLIHQLALPDCDVWFLKFDVDPLGRWLVFGSKTGKIYFYDMYLMSAETCYHEPDFVLTVSNRAVRQVSFDPSGEILMAVTDAFQVIRLDRLKHVSTEKEPPPFAERAPDKGETSQK